MSEIDHELELNHGTCANILKTLVQRGYVEQMGLKKGYKLGYMAYQLTASNEYNVQLINATKVLIDSLANKLNETVILSHIKNGNESSCTKHYVIRKSRYVPHPNQQTYRATTGRMILAHYSPKETKRFYTVSQDCQRQKIGPKLRMKQN